MPTETAPLAAHRFRVGQLDLRVLDGGGFALPFDWFAANARPLAQAEAVAHGELPTDFMPLRINNLLIDTGGQLVLVDTGFGAFSLNPAAGKLPHALKAEGIAPEDIDIVLMTHLHPDHAGGALDPAGKPAFPNARYLVNRTGYDYWLADPSLVELSFADDDKAFVLQVATGAVAALKDVLELVEPGEEVAPGVTVLAAPGHTPGHVAIEVASEGERLLHVVDAASVPSLHLAHPEWFLKVDLWPGQAVMTRNELFDRAAAENLLVQTYHFAFPGQGRVQAAGDDWLWDAVV